MDSSVDIPPVNSLEEKVFTGTDSLFRSLYGREVDSESWISFDYSVEYQRIMKVQQIKGQCAVCGIPFLDMQDHPDTDCLVVKQGDEYVMNPILFSLDSVRSPSILGRSLNEKSDYWLSQSRFLMEHLYLRKDSGGNWDACIRGTPSPQIPAFCTFVVGPEATMDFSIMCIWANFGRSWDGYMLKPRISAPPFWFEPFLIATSPLAGWKKTIRSQWTSPREEDMLGRNGRRVDTAITNSMFEYRCNLRSVEGVE